MNYDNDNNRDNSSTNSFIMPQNTDTTNNKFIVNNQVDSNQNNNTVNQQQSKSFMPNFNVSATVIESTKEEIPKRPDLMRNNSTDLYQTTPRVYAVKKEKNNIWAIIIISLIVLLPTIYFVYTYMDTATKKMECVSNIGSITITYNKKTITGYKADKLTYDLYEQRTYADEVGIKAYLDEFETWFKNNTQGSCKR